MKKWIKSNWGVSIGTAIFSLILTVIYDLSKEKPILSTVWRFIIWIWDLLISFLNLNLKIWWIIIGVAILIFILFVIDKFKKVESSLPDFYSYTEDKIKQWKWTWKWVWNIDKNAWMLSDMQAHCPDCDTPLIDNSNAMFGLSFDCPRCNYKASGYNQCDEQDKIERIIFDNIERKRKRKEHY